MKKFTALLLVLAMVAGVSAAFGASPSAEEVSYVTVTGEGDIAIVWTSENDIGDDGTNPVEEAVSAQSKGSALDVLPQEIRDQLPEGYTVVNEIRTMKLEGNLDNLDKLAELNAVIKFDTPYAEDEIVYLAVGIPGETETEWVLLEGLGNADQNLEVTFDHDTLMKIGPKAFVVMAISKA